MTLPAGRSWAVAVSGFVALAVLALAGQSPTFDLLIVGGRVMDGSGSPARDADVGISGDRIAALGDLSQAAARTRIDASGRLVTPGFIDAHSHAAEGLERDGLEQARPLLAQGITTIVANQDGGGPVDLRQQRTALEQRRPGVNVALLVGHNSIRRAQLGVEDREPAADELGRMEGLVATAMADGAYGLSSGLFYAPGMFARTPELIALARVAGRQGGVYISHIRDESSYGIGLLRAVDEVIEIAEQGDVTGIVTHMKALGPDAWGLATEAVARIERARARNVRVYADQYAYEASSTSLAAALVPGWAQAGGDAAFKMRTAEPSTRTRILDEMRTNIKRRGGPASLVVAQYPPDRTIEGRSLEQIAAARAAPAERAALDLIEQGRVSIVSFNMSERDIEHVMRQPWTMTSSDGGLVAIGEGVPHPRNYGAFSRKLAVYARERCVLSLEAAIRSMTGLTSEVFSLADRGRLQPGLAADVLVFDPAAIRDTATYQQPHQLAVGMHTIVVNGVVVLDGGRWTEARPGRVLRKEPGK